MCSRSLVAAVVIGVALVVASPRAAVQKPPDLSPKALVAAAGKYVTEYAAKLAFVLAEETYLQETYDSHDHRSGSRRMKGDVFLTYLQADREWIAVHDVAEVDGQPVTDREGLQSLLAQGSMQSVVKKVADRNARFNIGSIGRNFNEPTLALMVVEPKRASNFSFSREKVDLVGGQTLVTLSFKENDRPTLVGTSSGAPVFSRGDLVVEADTGRVRRTRIAFKYSSIDAELTTEYAPEPKIDLWVPLTFTEHYEGQPAGLKEIIICSARYTNYRRFEVLGRIK